MIKIYFSEEDKIYYYEGTGVFKNKYGIKDIEKLKEAEEKIVAVKIAEFKTSVQISATFDFEYLKRRTISTRL